MSNPSHSEPMAPCQKLPASSCLIAHDEFRQVRDDVAEIKSALLGNEHMGHTGIIHRVRALEAEVKAHDRKLMTWTAILTAAGTAAVFLKDKLLP
jgi:hypothetical protein